MRIAATLWLAAGALYAVAAPRQVPRTILALYDGREYHDVRDIPIHMLMEMPLNHLGLKVSYYDVNAPLPTATEDVRGILTWFETTSMARPLVFIDWARNMLDSGVRMVIAGDPGVSFDLAGRATPPEAINRLLGRLGLRMADAWIPVTYDARVLYKDAAMVEFERPFSKVPAPFTPVVPIDKRARSYLIVERANQPETRSHLVMTLPNGGYIAPGCTHYSNLATKRVQWYLNPFEFFRMAFATDELPKPDTTTISGRRIFYSHIDGDGWRNATEVEPYIHQKAFAAEVILKEAIERYPDLPVTVGPIAADLDPAWYGTREAARVARRIFALAQVEAGSHTYSHPLDWEFLARNPTNADRRMRPVIFGGLSDIHWPLLARVTDYWREGPVNEVNRTQLNRGLKDARSYNLYPFRLPQEIEGSIAYIQGLLPPGKKVEILQWSGSTMASEEAVAASRAAGVRNINGGDSRFDPEFPSYGWVAPLGRQVGGQRQIYSSACNENVYTDLWHSRFFGYRHLLNTVRNTESPRRVKPFNVYYHMFSGQKEPSLLAVADNLAYARSVEIAPVRASVYAGIVDGFYSARVIELGRRRWRIENRDLLQTFRIDHAGKQAVDFARSSGVIGERLYQDSLYIALDPADPAPVIALQETAGPAATRPYLVDSRWQISRLRIEGGSFHFLAQGFGRGEMRWQVPGAGLYKVEVSGRRVAEVRATGGLLRFDLAVSAVAPIEVSVTREARP